MPTTGWEEMTHDEKKFCEDFAQVCISSDPVRKQLVDALRALASDVNGCTYKDGSRAVFGCVSGSSVTSSKILSEAFAALAATGEKP